MTDRAQDLLREALTLPINQRADVAAELLASLDEPSTMDAKYPEEELASAAGGTDFRTAMIHATITGLEEDESADEGG